MRKVVIPYPQIDLNTNRAGGIQDIFKLAALPFWCKDNTLHIKKPIEYVNEGCCLTHTVGLPKHPATKNPMPLTPYQVEFAETILTNHRTTPIEDPNKYHVNKGRQMGFTEIVIRTIQYSSLHKYAGSNVGIIAATNGNLAKKDLRRFQRLFKNVPELITEKIRNNKMLLATGTVVEAFPASEEAITGDTDYKCIFLDEAAKWKNLDDRPIFNSIMPIVNTNASDLFLVSTPKGPIKTFYDIHKKPQDFQKLVYDLWCAKGNLYSKKKIEYMLAHATEDANQEYLCKFSFGKDAVLGEITDKDRSEEVVEWDLDEDDGYVEEEEDDEWLKNI